MHNPNHSTPTPYLAHPTHHTVQVPPQSHPHPSTHCHPVQPFVQPARSPSFAFEPPSLHLVSPTHPYLLGFNDNVLSTAHSRPTTSSGQSLPCELSLQHYLPADAKGEHCAPTPEQSPINPWSLPMLSGVAPSPGTGISRSWPKTMGPTPQVFHPSVNTQAYHNFILDPTDSSTNFSSESEAFPSAALPTSATSILAVDIPHPRNYPQDPVVYLSGSESDSGQELDDERNIAHDARRDQWTSACATSPRSRSPAVTLSRRFASFLATEVPIYLYLPAHSAYSPIIGRKIGFKSSPQGHRLCSSTSPPHPVVF
jgi:hypothetical protein